MLIYRLKRLFLLVFSIFLFFTLAVQIKLFFENPDRNTHKVLKAGKINEPYKIEYQKP